jgi:hypothetical protein
MLLNKSSIKNINTMFKINYIDQNGGLLDQKVSENKDDDLLEDNFSHNEMENFANEDD